MKKLSKALIFNILIIILEIVSLTMSIRELGRLAVEYYTIDSNILALISSTLFVCFYKKDSKWIQDLKYISTCCLTVTFLVVIFILAPMDHFNYQFYMLHGTMLYQHTICPIFAIITYMLYERRSTKTYLCFAFTILYSIVLVILNLAHKVVGPYFFLMVTKNPILKTVMWFIIIFIMNYLIGLFLTKFRIKKL